MQPEAMFGPLDALAPYIEHLVLVLVLANLGVRLMAHRAHTEQATDGEDAMSRYLPLEVSNVLLVLASFYFMTVHPHGGLVMSVLVVGMVLTDFFEFEARKVEARTDEPVDQPKGAITASMVVLAYAAFQSLFFLVEPLWSIVFG